ncbi:YPDG domain-containing protein, partial [Aerococcaceae bacterium zg-A91]|uniref:YPDG domain-containing protein n=1 Tax=Aerococcaceae bacterium zg-1292 TaxID=2774330 RepID=UPI001BD88903|nr:YPDG domain-containing protein [Aerococcaceae bacterium zg-A91]
MLGKNNMRIVSAREANKKLRYSIKKFSVGVASVLIGATFLSSNQLVSAQEVTNGEETEVVEAAPASEAETLQEEPIQPVTEEAPVQPEETTEASAENTSDEAVNKEVPETTTDTAISEETNKKVDFSRLDEIVENIKRVMAISIPENTDMNAATYHAYTNLLAEINEAYNSVVALHENSNATQEEVDAAVQKYTDLVNRFEQAVGNLETVKPEEDKVQPIEETVKPEALKATEKDAENSKSEALDSAIGTRAVSDNKVKTGTRAFESELQKLTEKGAIYSPGKKGQAQGYEGTAWVYRGANINHINRENPISGANVYLQWMNGKGFVSPVYRTTTNEDGTYYFDLSKSVKDSAGVEHKFKFGGDTKFAVRTWLENPDPEKYNVIKHGDQKTGFHTWTKRTNEDWGQIGINRIKNGQAVVQEKLYLNKWLHKPESQWTKAPTEDGIWQNKGMYGKITGNVWYENGEPAGSDSRTWKRDTWDVKATGVKVLASYVNDEVAKKFDEWRKGRNKFSQEEFKAAQQSIVEEYQKQNGPGSHIAETVVGTVDKNGSYYIPFRGLYGKHTYAKGNVSDSQFGKLVENQDVTNNRLVAWNGTGVKQKHRHINSDYMYVSPLIDNYAMWSNNYQNNLFTNADDGRGIHKAEMLVGANGSKHHFAAIAAQPMHDVLKYDTNKNYAKPGDVAQTKSGGLLPNQEYLVRWFKDGEAIGAPIKKIAGADGTLDSVPFEVPKNLDKNATFTSAVFLPDKSTNDLTDALASDAFTALVTEKQNNIYQPSYSDSDATLGTETKVRPTFTKKDGDTLKQVETSEVPLTKTSPSFMFENGNNIPEGLSINPMTGEITFKPTKEEYIGKEFIVPVTVTYEDGTTENVNAKFSVAAKKADAEKYTPSYKEKLVKPGEEAKSPVSFKDGETPTKAKYAIKDGFKAPDGYTATINETTGEVSLKAPERPSKDTAEVIEVPVVVTYADGTKDEDVMAKFSLDTDGDGTPDNKDQDDDGDGIPDTEEEKDGTNPKNPYSVGASIEKIEDQTVKLGNSINTITVKATKVPKGGKVDVKDLPKGVTFDPKTNQISGTPTEPGKYIVSVGVLGSNNEPVLDKDNKPVFITFKITVEKPDQTEKLAVTTKSANVTENQPVPDKTNVVTTNKPGAKVTSTPTNGLSVDEEGNLTGKPTITDWNEKEESR